MLPVRGLESNIIAVLLKNSETLLELITNATIVDDAIGFVTEKGEALANPEPTTDTPLIQEKEQPLFYILAA